MIENYKYFENLKNRLIDDALVKIIYNVRKYLKKIKSKKDINIKTKRGSIGKKDLYNK